MKYTNIPFEKALAENLSLYCCEAPFHGKDLFQTHREVALARYALTQQANTYQFAIQLLTRMLEESTDSATTNPKLLTSVMVAINSIEQKSVHLISSVRAVTDLLGKAVAIDVDKAALSSILLRLPALVKESISSISDDPLLADQISSNLDIRLNEMMQTLRFNPDHLSSQASASGYSNIGITFDQYQSLHDSVPAQP
jgi:hypothetical protein